MLTSLEKKANTDQLPDLQFLNIYNYPVYTSSNYTKEDMKANQSLDGYKYVVSGWVHGMQNWNVPEKQRVLLLCQRMYQPILISNASL